MRYTTVAEVIILGAASIYPVDPVDSCLLIAILIAWSLYEEVPNSHERVSGIEGRSHQGG